MKIIGHRGAAGTELENTLASLQVALDMGVYALEIDVHKTKDNHLVLSHDPTPLRLAGDPRRISDLTLKQLKKIPLYSGSDIPTLAEALEVIGDTLVFIEIKQTGTARLLLETLEEFPRANVRIASFKHNELEQLSKLGAPFKLYALERTRPFDIIHEAKQMKLYGIGLNYWLLNPLTYYLIKRAKLDLYVYTVNSPFQAKFLSLLYPDISICTDYPKRFKNLRLNRRGKARG